MKTNKRISIVFALGAGLLSLLAFIAYSWNTLMGETHPSISSWLVWSILTILNFTSYKKLSGDWAKSILPTANSIMTLVILACAINKGSFGDLSVTDIVCLCIGIFAAIAWWVMKSAHIAQFILQIALIIGFIPTFIGAYNSPETELSLSWLLWTVSYVFQFVAVKLNSKNSTEFIYPVSMFFCHGIVFVLSCL